MADFYVNLYSILEDNAGIGIESQAVEHATAWLSDLAKRNGIDTIAVNVIVGTPAVEIRRLAEKLDSDFLTI